MCKHYSTPVLLIEFDPDKAFALQSMADIGDDIRANNVTSKLTLLLLHFPKLRYAQPVLPFSKFNKMFFGYFDLGKFFLDRENT